MSQQKLTIEITETGELEVDLDGFKGKGCSELIDLIENAMGQAERTNKPEYDQRGSASRKSFGGIINKV